MKKIFKIVPCLLLSALTIVSACACNDGVSDARRRMRKLKEQPIPQQEQTLNEDELDPDFLVEAETNDAAGDETSDGTECPDCPKEPNKEDKPFRPRHGRCPHCGRRKHTKPLPAPLPDEDGSN